MTKETKIGLLVGMGVIILIGILISDHLSVAQRQQQAQLSAGIPEIDQDMVPQAPGVDRTVVQGGRRVEPLPLPEELTAPPAATPATTPVVIKQDLLQAMVPTAPATAAAQPATVVPADPQPTTADRTLIPSRFENDLVVVPGPGASAPVHNTAAASQPAPTRLSLPNAQPPGPRQTVHFVDKAETLSDISRKYYGTAGEWKRIYEANKDKMSSPNALRPGVRLIIPPMPGAQAATATQPETPAGIRVVAERPAPKPQPATREYTVASGDTLSSIAAKFYGSAGKWNDLYQLNKDRIKDPNRVAEGTVLRVPGR